MSPDDQQTKDEARIVHPVFEARLSRLAVLRDALPANGVPFNLDDQTAFAIMAALDRVKRGTR